MISLFLFLVDYHITFICWPQDWLRLLEGELLGAVLEHSIEIEARGLKPLHDPLHDPLHNVALFISL